MSDTSIDTDNGLLSPPGTPTEKPPTPYLVGTDFKIRRHAPPLPFGGTYSQVNPADDKELKTTSQLEWCLSHPPTPGTTYHDDTQHFTIVETIRSGENCGAQILLTQDGQIAKVYDPLYYNFTDSDFPQFRVDITTSADTDYVIEAAAYQELHDTEIQESVMPKYFGSWTLDIPTIAGGEKRIREVRMILIEYISGTCMLDILPWTLSKEARGNVMVKAIEAASDLFFAGLRHDDVSPRNIILSPSPLSSTTHSSDIDYADPTLRAYIIDFNLSCVTRLKFSKPLAPQYHNPLFCWVGASMWSSWGWLPFDDDERVAWMWGIWGDGGQEGKYARVERDPKSCLGEPKRPTLALID